MSGLVTLSAGAALAPTTPPINTAAAKVNSRIFENPPLEPNLSRDPFDRSAKRIYPSSIGGGARFSFNRLAYARAMSGARMTTDGPDALLRAFADGPYPQNLTAEPPLGGRGEKAFGAGRIGARRV
jgi:hypothetical protein